MHLPIAMGERRDSAIEHEGQCGLVLIDCGRHDPDSIWLIYAIRDGPLSAWKRILLSWKNAHCTEFISYRIAAVNLSICGPRTTTE